MTYLPHLGSLLLLVLLFAACDDSDSHVVAAPRDKAPEPVAPMDWQPDQETPATERPAVSPTRPTPSDDQPADGSIGTVAGSAATSEPAAVAAASPASEPCAEIRAELAQSVGGATLEAAVATLSWSRWLEQVESGQLLALLDGKQYEPAIDVVRTLATQGNDTARACLLALAARPDIDVLDAINASHLVVLGMGRFPVAKKAADALFADARAFVPFADAMALDAGITDPHAARASYAQQLVFGGTLPDGDPLLNGFRFVLTEVYRASGTGRAAVAAAQLIRRLPAASLALSEPSGSQTTPRYWRLLGTLEILVVRMGEPQAQDAAVVLDALWHIRTHSSRLDAPEAPREWHAMAFKPLLAVAGDAANRWIELYASLLSDRDVDTRLDAAIAIAFGAKDELLLERAAKVLGHGNPVDLGKLRNMCLGLLQAQRSMQASKPYSRP